MHLNVRSNGEEGHCGEAVGRGQLQYGTGPREQSIFEQWYVSLPLANEQRAHLLDPLSVLITRLNAFYNVNIHYNFGIFWISRSVRSNMVIAKL